MASSVSVSKDGKIVYVYYVDTPGYGCSYSVEEKKISEASNISDDFWYLDVISEGDNESNFLSLPSDLIQVGNIYVNDDKQYSVMIVDGITSYGDIYLGISDGIEFDKYKLFN